MSEIALRVENLAKRHHIGRVIETMPDFVERSAGQSIVRTFERYRVRHEEHGIDY